MRLIMTLVGDGQERSHKVASKILFSYPNILYPLYYSIQIFID